MKTKTQSVGELVAEKLDAITFGKKQDNSIPWILQVEYIVNDEVEKVYGKQTSGKADNTDAVHSIVNAETGLAPCPFCGSSDLHIYHGHGGNKVKCMNCSSSGVLVDVWNRRAPLISSRESKPT